jgi:hypothetical protein
LVELGAAQRGTILEKSLTEAGLWEIVARHSPVELSTVRGQWIDEIGVAIAQGVEPITFIRPLSLWERVKNEIHILLCTDDTKYAELRRKLSIKGSYTPTLIVDMISVAVGANVGAAAVAVVPLVALCLFGVLQVGKNAYCLGFWEVKIK